MPAPLWSPAVTAWSQVIGGHLGPLSSVASAAVGATDDLGQIGDVLGTLLNAGSLGLVLLLFLTDRLVTGSTHRSAVASKDAEIAQLRQERDRIESARTELEKAAREEMLPALIQSRAAMERVLADFANEGTRELKRGGR